MPQCFVQIRPNWNEGEKKIFFKVHKKVECITKSINFHLHNKKIFWVLAFSYMYLVSVDPMDRSEMNIF